jgi:hypothetical protein
MGLNLRLISKGDKKDLLCPIYLLKQTNRTKIIRFRTRSEFR